MHTQNKLHIVIADDHPIFRRGLRIVIEADPLLTVVDEAEDGRSALAEVKRFQPQVVVLDLDMPLLDGMSVAREIRSLQLDVHIAFLTMHKDEATFNTALDLGVRGYVVKDSAANEIIGCIKAIAAGQSFISPVLSGHLLSRQAHSNSLSPNKLGINDLTTAERRVLRLIAAGKLNSEIAAELFISTRTVEHHRSNICSKLGLNGKHALLTYALTHKSEL